MNFQGEDVIACGWQEPRAGKAVGLQILYVGSDVEAAAKVVNSALDSNTVFYGRIFRGSFGGGQCLYRATKDDRPQVGPAPILPATGRK
jgi:hypothetical protein